MSEILTSPEWMAAGACSSVDPEVWFPEKGGTAKAARKVCDGCPVTAQCLDFALEHEEPYGVWGGKSTREREAIRLGWTTEKVAAQKAHAAWVQARRIAAAKLRAERQARDAAARIRGAA